MATLDNAYMPNGYITLDHTVSNQNKNFLILFYLMWYDASGYSLG